MTAACPLDQLVVLTSTQGKLATKRVVASRHGPPVIEGYPKGSTYFSFTEWPVSSFDDLVAALTELQSQCYSFVVRGAIRDGTDRQRARRLAYPRRNAAATLKPAPRRWKALDFDSIPCPANIDRLFEPDRVVEHVIQQLPAEFHSASCFWSFTASHCVKPGACLRLWYWADRAVEDRELKIWLADAPVDLSLYEPAQPTYTAAPFFVGMSDMVPFRYGTWTGYSDTVTPPVIAVEKPQAHSGWSPPESHLAGIKGLLLHRGGYAHHQGRIGDHEGGDGFHGPVKTAIGSYFRQNGAQADAELLRSDLEVAIRTAPRDPDKHDDAYIEHRIRDLVSLIAWTQRREEAQQAEEEKPEPVEAGIEPEPEPEVEPTYAAPPEGDTLDEARTRLEEEAQRFTETSFAHIEHVAALKAEAEDRGELERWQPPAPPVWGINADIGIGKTRIWRLLVAAMFVERGLHPVLSVPRHRLGDEIVRDFDKAGIVARDFRGREYPDPEQPGKAMCHDLERIKAIEEAGGSISQQACRGKGGQCAFYEVCGYQKQRREHPEVWIVPHQFLIHGKPKFIKCDTLGIDESFWSVALHGIERPVTLELSALIIGDRGVPAARKDRNSRFNATEDTADLQEISRAVYDVIMAEPDGRLRRAEVTQALHSARVSLDDLRLAYRLEWSRKIKLDDVVPGMPPAAVKELCGRAAAHNRQVGKLARFWRLLADTVAGNAARSPWLDLKHAAKSRKDNVEPAVHMAWCDGIHESWRGVPTMIMDATMPVGIVRRFYPGMTEPARITAPTRHVHVRQISDKPMSKMRLIPTDADTPENQTRRANVERVRRFIEVRAFEAGDGKVAVICNESLEDLLEEGAVPANVEIDHYNNVTGENRLSDVALLTLTGRPEAPPLVTELTARLLFETDIDEIAPDASGRVNYPLVDRAIRTRDGAVAVKGPQHPDPRVEEVRRAICEAGLIQSGGRGRGVNRTAADPLRLDILTNVVLPITVDEVTTWDAIQPKLVEVMRARGAAPVGYRDLAQCYPDLFTSAEAARKALKRENPGQIAIENIYIAVCPGFRVCTYRRPGTPGPPGRLYYDPRRIDPLAWLTERLGVVTVQPEPAADTEQAAAGKPPEEPVAAATPPAARKREWHVPVDNRPRYCGPRIGRPRQWCGTPIRQQAAMVGMPRRLLPDLVPGNDLDLPTIRIWARTR